jgi:hypothetical protein
MLHGFAANRVLIVVDGVRMNNAIHRSGFKLHHGDGFGRARVHDHRVLVVVRTEADAKGRSKTSKAIWQ